MVVTTIRLSPDKHRQLKLTAAARGTSIQKVLEQAIDQWLFEGQRPGRAARRARSVRGILKGVDVFALRRQERRKELEQDARLLQD